MENPKFQKLLIASVLSLIFPTALGIQQKFLPDLREYRVEGVVGRFVANRDAIERELQNRKQQGTVSDNDVKIELPSSAQHVPYNSSYQGEVMFFHETITDTTLAAELSTDLREQVATSYEFLTVAIPVVIGSKRDKASIFSLFVLTNTSKNLLFPLSTNTGETVQVDSIEKVENGTVVIRHMDDVMVYQVKDDVKHRGKINVGKDFDKVTGKNLTTTSYYLPFNWGCDLLGSQISFCQVLEGFQCELSNAKGDVCGVISTESSERSPVTMAIVSMTGIFREMFPFLAETVPTESFEAEYVDREHKTGIKYPCLI